MTLRISSAFRALSILVLLFVMMYVYANLPGQVGLSVSEVGQPEDWVSRNQFFFGSLITFAVSNGIFVTLIRLLKKQEKEKWETVSIGLNGMVVWLNLFFSLGLIFISAFNSLEKVDLNSFGVPLIVIGIIALAWVLGLLVLTLRTFQRG